MNFVIDFVAYTFRCKNYQCSMVNVQWSMFNGQCSMVNVFALKMNNER